MKTDDVESVLCHLDGHPHVFQRLGQVWVLKYDGKMVLMEHAKGMMYLSRLLIDPDRTLPVAFLVAAETGDDPRIFSGSSEEMIDDQAMAEYKQRYVDLQVELAEAEHRNDLSRIPQLQEGSTRWGMRSSEFQVLVAGFAVRVKWTKSASEFQPPSREQLTVSERSTLDSGSIFTMRSILASPSAIPQSAIPGGLRESEITHTAFRTAFARVMNRASLPPCFQPFERSSAPST